MKKTMKKLAALALGLLILAVSLAALADDTAAEVYGQITDLLFNEGNVTLNLRAEMSLDGVWFKTAEIVLKQDGIYGFRQMLLTSPKKDGTERHNGYTIVTEGSIYHLMEVYSPGVYRDGTCGEHDTLIRKSPVTEQLVSLGSVLASQADLLLGKDAVKEAEDGTILIELDENTPELANYALSELVRFAAERYYGVNYDIFSTEEYNVRIEDYVTVREGIIYTMRDLGVKKVQVTLKKDAEGKLQAADGTVALKLRTVSGETRELEITFTAEVTDRGSTVVKSFDPEDYGVTLAEGAIRYDYEEGDEGEDVETLEGDELIKYSETAAKIWAGTAYPLEGFNAADGYRFADGRIEVLMLDGEGTMLETLLDSDGIPIELSPVPMPWWGVGTDEHNYEPSVDEETDSKAKELMMNFLKEFNPKVLETVKDLKVDSTFEINGVLYGQYNEDPLDQEDGGVLFLVRLDKDMRIEYYTTISNG